MKFDTKLAVVLREDLQVWQKLNVTAFLMSGIGGTQNIVGQEYMDNDGIQYLPMSQQPINVKFNYEVLLMKSGHEMSLFLEGKVVMHVEYY